MSRRPGGRVRGQLVVFAKQPLPGAVKTRLTPPLGAGEAAELYGRMLEDVLEASAAMARRLGLAPVLAVHPGRAAPELAHKAPAPFRVVAQRGLDLAERMAWAVGEAASAGELPILLRGSDSPMLTAELAADALAALADADLVIAPDLDGGYSLVGLRRTAAGVFDHPMSTGSVAEDTRSCAEGMGLSTHLLQECFDIDTVSDLRWLAESRTRLGHLCPRTLTFLDQHDLWRHLGAAAQPLGRG